MFHVVDSSTGPPTKIDPPLDIVDDSIVSSALFNESKIGFLGEKIYTIKFQLSNLHHQSVLKSGMMKCIIFHTYMTALETPMHTMNSQLCFVETFLFFQSMQIVLSQLNLPRAN